MKSHILCYYTIVWTEWTYIMITHILCYFYLCLSWVNSWIDNTHCVILTFVWTEWTHIMITHTLCYLDLCLNWVKLYNDNTHTVLFRPLSVFWWLPPPPWTIKNNFFDFLVLRNVIMLFLYYWLQKYKNTYFRILDVLMPPPILK